MNAGSIGSIGTFVDDLGRSYPSSELPKSLRCPALFWILQWSTIVSTHLVQNTEICILKARLQDKPGRKKDLSMDRKHILQMTDTQFPSQKDLVPNMPVDPCSNSSLWYANATGALLAVMACAWNVCLNKALKLVWFKNKTYMYTAIQHYVIFFFVVCIWMYLSLYWVSQRRTCNQCFPSALWVSWGTQVLTSFSVIPIHFFQLLARCPLCLSLFFTHLYTGNPMVWVKMWLQKTGLG